MTLRICVPIKYKTLAPILRDLTAAQKKADLLEIWFDEINELTPQKIKQITKKINKPLIYKHTNEKNLETVLAFKPDFIDIDLKKSNEITNKIRKLSPDTKIIISYHNFKKTPSKTDLNKLIKTIKSKKPDLLKIATYANKFTDSILMLSLLSEQNAKKDKSNLIFLCMGREGKITRLTGHLFGNYLMYFPLHKRTKTASGQITLDKIWDLKSEL